MDSLKAKDAQVRFTFIDILKGISILLIVYGHIIPGTIPYLDDWFITFHMPLFFFVSGLLFNDEKYGDNFLLFLRARIKSLIIPYAIFGLVVAIGYMFIELDYKQFLVNLFRMGWSGYALWFIPVLFLTELVYFPICKLKYGYTDLLMLLSVVLSYYSSIYVGLVSYNALLAFCGIWFYGMGNRLRIFMDHSSRLHVSHIVFIILLGISLSLIYYPICKELPEWFINKIPSPVFYFSPLFAIIGMIGVSLLVEKLCAPIIVSFLVVCGKQSFIILAFHQIICMIAQKYVCTKFAILIMIVFLSFVVWFIPKYIPWILGKYKAK